MLAIRLAKLQRAGVELRRLADAVGGSRSAGPAAVVDFLVLAVAGRCVRVRRDPATSATVGVFCLFLLCFFFFLFFLFLFFLFLFVKSCKGYGLIGLTATA